MRIGIYGGSFDPVHYGHVNVARTAVADLALDKLVVIPAAVSPFKTDAGPGAGPWQRLEMVKAAFADVPNAVVDMREVERGGVYYAIDTVRSIVAETPTSV
ncbi:MAG: adenylyltransferase/cytidyltransferase family protein, partial [Kiritimatiellae bacterium]|nr:adenylyltransferase/cytidyltransferase family protein [Kiritimatiellia bacterium]